MILSFDFLKMEGDLKDTYYIIVNRILIFYYFPQVFYSILTHTQFSSVFFFKVNHLSYQKILFYTHFFYLIFIETILCIYILLV